MKLHRRTTTRIGQHKSKDVAMKDISCDAKKEGTRNYVALESEVLMYCEDYPFTFEILNA